MNQPDASASPDAFPVATVRPPSRWELATLLQSKMWWITLVCLGIAIYVAWHSHRPAGVKITIDFPEGHGLKAGDALRHRGIDVGIVTDVKLASDLQAIRTTVELEESAAGVANEGSQFWIVRPQFSLTNVSGLDTAVGAKYIAVRPGIDGDARAREFQGRTDPPMVSLNQEGIEITLRGTESFGINPGSPVTYRGIRVGQITSVNLGKNALDVAIHAKIEREYQTLLRRGSKFWKTTGVDVDFGLRGFHMSTESLTSLARGGVSFMTPQTKRESDLERIADGHEYTLAEKMDSDWQRDAASLQLNSP